MPEARNQLLSTRQVAKLFGDTTSRTITNWITKGVTDRKSGQHKKLDARDVGGRHFITPEAVNAFAGFQVISTHKESSK